ncbi:MAG: SAV_6107 family HEPN domain-containing protein [Micropruina sp.]|uniref:SAV_6107 family HEPN domain-containing protein n=1 Tax=Micropruina sp. TaxID=2737536 RepID=UPI0039E69E62
MEVDDVQPAGNQPWRWPAPAVGVGGGVMAVPELAGALAALTQAELAERPAERFLLAHLAALRVAAVVLACRASGGAGRARPRDVWQLLAETAPEYAEWAGFFAASALKREAVRAGAVAMVSAREADDLLRDVGIFHDRVARRLSPAPARREVS